MMIVCPICNKQNHHLSVTCSLCGGYIQTTVDNLDLFTTAWQVIERPQKAFYKIAIARHKNYRIFLSAIAGIAIVFFIFWLIKAGEYTTSLLNFLAAGYITGPIVGVLTVMIFTLLLIIIIKISREKIKYRNASAVVSYAMIPLVISVIIILPIEIMALGLFFFTANPSPYQLKPITYITLLSLDGIFGIWSVILLWMGIKSLTARGWIYSLIVLIITLSVFVGMNAMLINYLLSKY